MLIRNTATALGLVLAIAGVQFTSQPDSYDCGACGGRVARGFGAAPTPIPAWSTCPTCAPIVEHVEAMRPTVTPPTVRRVDAATIVVEGAYAAGTRPYTWPVHADEAITFEVEPGEPYTAWAYVDADDGTAIPFNFREAEPADPVVTRPTAGLIVVEGATHAVTIPPARSVLVGHRISVMGEACVATEDGGRIVFEVEHGRDYEVFTGIIVPPADGQIGETRLAEFDLPVTRAHAVQAMIQLAAEADAAKRALGPVGVYEYLTAFAAMAEEEAAHGQR